MKTCIEAGEKKGKKSKSGNAIDLRVEMWWRISLALSLFISLRFYFSLGDNDDDDDKQRHTYTIALLGYNSVGQQKISDKKERRKKFSTNEATATTNIKNYEHIFERRKMCFGIMLLSLPSQFCTAVEVNGFPFCVCVFCLFEAFRGSSSSFVLRFSLLIFLCRCCRCYCCYHMLVDRGQRDRHAQQT